MECPKCKTKNEEPRKFCRKCGAKLSIICPDCGFENLPEDIFCGGCGCKLKDQEERPLVDFNQPQSYTPKFLADKILTTRSSLEGERKLVTVLFVDVANYTSMSEKLDPEEVHQIMDGCFKILMDEIHKYEGTINQFTGDGVMALFGAPVSHEDHAQRACYAALSIQNSMGDYGEKIRKETDVEFKMRIGLNSGKVIVGSIGDDLRMDYTAVGDTTNLASRMESNASPGAILLSKNTQRLVRDYFELNFIGMIEVKGKKEAQESFQLVRAGDVDTRMGASVSKGLTRFVGRKNSMATIMEAFETAKSGSGHILAVVGEAGVGKSRLLLEMRNRLSQDEIIYLEGQCLHYGGSMAYLPILDILKSYFDIQEGDREYIIKKKMKERVVSLDDNLVTLLPPIQDLLSLTMDDDKFTKLKPKVKKEKTFEAIRDLIIRISHDKTMIMAIEDLHWMDRTSEEFLDYLIGWLANSPILLILLYRPEYTHQWASKSYYTQIRLNQLGTASSSDLIRAILEEGEAAPELKKLIIDRAAGNPLFMEEFTHTLLENGSIEKRNDQYTLNLKPSEIQVPDTIQGIIAARMDRLEDNIKRTMQVASVIGRDFAFRILQSIMGMREEIKAQLLNLQGLELIYEKSLFPELEYIFKHALIQEVAYNSLLVKRRSEIHKRIGEAIESLYTDRLDEFYEMLAYHYMKGEDSDKAYQYLKLSAEKAARNYATTESFRFYSQAIEVLSLMPDTVENKRKQIEVRLLMATSWASMGFPEATLQVFKDGEKISEEIGDERSLAIFHSWLGNYYSVKADPSSGIRYSEKSFQMAEKIEDVDLMAPFGYTLCVSYYASGFSLQIVDVASKVIKVLEKTSRESGFFERPFNLYVFMHGFSTFHLAHLGKFDEGEALCKKVLSFAQSIEHLPSLGFAEMCCGIRNMIRADGRSAVKYLENSLKHMEEGNVHHLFPLILLHLGQGYLLLGELETARNILKKGLKTHKDVGLSYFISGFYCGLSMVHLDSGELESAQSCAEKALNAAQKNKENHFEGRSWTDLGRILGKKGTEQNDKVQTKEAEAHILKGIRILEELKNQPYVSIGYLWLGELYADMGLEGKALENLKTAEAMFKEMGMDYYLDKTQKLLERIQP